MRNPVTYVSPTYRRERWVVAAIVGVGALGVIVAGLLGIALRVVS